MERPMTHPGNMNIGFVSTRFEGTDGVSLEAEKWAAILERMGHRCFYFAGVCDRDPAVSRVIPEAFFHHPEMDHITNIVFSQLARPPEITRRILELAAYFKEEIYRFGRDFEIDLLIVENALAIPVNIPLGMALTEFISETAFPTIAHHHDFFWERQRFITNCVWDYLHMAFPPIMPFIQNVVINTIASHELSRRTGISAWVIPNVMDYHNPPPPPDDYSATFREDMGIAPDEYLFLQPTRVVQRKGIEHAIELIRRLDVKARLVITHAAGDEGREYEQRIHEFADLLQVPVIFVSKSIQTERGSTEDGRKIYSLNDAYHHADVVTYPSTIEGFGNAFLEAVYFRKPLVVNKYSIFEVDIMPKGFEVIAFDGFITRQTLERTCQMLRDPEMAQRMVEKNYELAKRHFSYAILERHLRTIFTKIFGEENSVPRGNGRL